MLQLNTQKPSVFFQNRTSLQFSVSFTLIITQHNHELIDTSTTERKQTEEEHSVLPTEVSSM
jgi:hypothetical protein